MHPLLQDIFTAILDGNAQEAQSKVRAALDAQLEPATMLNEAMVAAMAEVGRRFEEGEYFVPEMLIAARAMKESLAILKPRLLQANVKATGKVILGTVRGDLHDIGKNLVGIMLEGAGYEVLDMGTDVPPEKFVEAVRSSDANLVGLSALLTTTMPGMQAVIQALEAAGLRQRVKVMVGGAPVTDSYAQKIGADGYAPDASRAVSLAKSLL